MLTFEIIAGAILGILAIAPFVRRGEVFLRSYFALTLVAAALIYVLFSLAGLAMGTATFNWMLAEFSGLLFFSIFAYVGIKGRPWALSLGWLLHLFWDLSLHGGPGASFVPDFYPGTCLGFDLVFAGFITYYFYSKSAE